MMSPDFDLRPEVEREIEDATSWYGARNPALVQRFLGEVDYAFMRIAENPMQFPKVYRDVRRVLFMQFPFGVYYLPVRDTVDILAIMHLSRHPDTWRLPDR